MLTLWQAHLDAAVAHRPCQAGRFCSRLSVSLLRVPARSSATGAVSAVISAVSGVAPETSVLNSFTLLLLASRDA